MYTYVFWMTSQNIALVDFCVWSYLIVDIISNILENFNQKLTFRYVKFKIVYVYHCLLYTSDAADE